LRAEDAGHGQLRDALRFWGGVDFGRFFALNAQFWFVAMTNVLHRTTPDVARRERIRTSMETVGNARQAQESRSILCAARL
jgi:hypothetical protein